VDIWVPPSIISPIQDAAVCHFLTSYTPGSHFDYLTDFSSRARAITPLYSSLHAAALANLSRERQEPCMMIRARKFYTQALEETKAALQSEDATLDCTLISVLVLSLFETVAQQDRISEKAWDVHTEGAVVLLALRGPDQFRTALGQKLYIHVSNNIRVSCAQRAVPLPPEFVKLDKLASKYLDFSIPVLQYWPIVDKFIELQTMVRQNDPEKSSERLTLASRIEIMSIKMAGNLKDPWRYEVTQPEDAPKEAFRQSAHRYATHAVARLWNTIWLVRILVNEVIYDEMEMIENDEVNSRCLIQTIATETAEEMAINILSSVPQFIRSPESKQLTATIASGFIYPISAVGASKLVSSDAKQYAIETVALIGKKAKLPQAIQVAEMLNKGTISLKM
jgi:hypothetical protein